MLSGEQLITMRKSLWLILTAFINKGLNLWCVETDTLPVEIGKIVYNMPAGVTDILNLQLRRGTFTVAGAITGAGGTLTYGSATRVNSVVVRLPSVGTFTLRVDGSEDGVTWFEAGRKSFTVAAAETVCVDLVNQTPSVYWRVVELVPSVTFDSVSFVSAGYEIPFSQLSRDDYMNLPDKGAPGNPLQYWYDKQYDTPRISVWQVAQTTEMQFVLTSQKTVQDVGAMSNILAVPARWLNAVISELAVRAYMTLPKQARTDIPLADLRTIAADDLQDATNAESDGGPLTLAPAIGCYTR